MDFREIFEQTRKTLAQKGYEIRDKDISEYAEGGDLGCGFMTLRV